MSTIKIYTNAPVNAVIFLEDADGSPVSLDAAGTYKMEVRKSLGSTILLTFETGSAAASVSVLSQDLGDGVVRDLFAFSTLDVSLIEDLKPGMYVADVLRTDDPNWECGVDVEVIQGVTIP